MSTSVMMSQRTAFGDLVRYWRRVRAMSQLDLAAAASTTPRYMSFVETGRARASRDMVLRLAVALDVPLRDRNGLLVAAGFAPIYPEHDLDHPEIERVMAALDRVLDRHAPYPAVVMDRSWDVVRVNTGAARLFAGLCAPEPVPDPANVLRLMLEPGPVREAVENWDEVAPALLERARREAVGGVMDLTTAELVQRLRTGDDAAVFAAAPRSIAPLIPIIDVQFTLRRQHVAVVLGHLDDRNAGRRHSSRAAHRVVLPLRRRHRGALGPHHHRSHLTAGATSRLTTVHVLRPAFASFVGGDADGVFLREDAALHSPPRR